MFVTAHHLYLAIDVLPLDQVLKMAAEGANMLTVAGPLSDLEDDTLDLNGPTQMPGSSLDVLDRDTLYAPCTDRGTMYSMGARK